MSVEKILNKLKSENTDYEELLDNIPDFEEMDIEVLLTKLEELGYINFDIGGQDAED